MRRRLHDPVPEPYGHDPRRYGLGGWLSANQFAIFEMVYQMGAGGIRFLNGIAWGGYDWIQGNAIEVLLRLAADGVERESIVKNVVEEFPDIRYEAKLYALEPLVGRLDGEPVLATLFTEIAGRCPAFRETWDEVAVRT